VFERSVRREVGGEKGHGGDGATPFYTGVAGWGTIGSQAARCGRHQPGAGGWHALA
jgi:hypothetical protein